MAVNPSESKFESPEITAYSDGPNTSASSHDSRVKLSHPPPTDTSSESDPMLCVPMPKKQALHGDVLPILSSDGQTSDTPEYLIHLRAHFRNFQSYINLNSLYPWLMEYFLLTPGESEHLLNVHIGENQRIFNLLGFMEKKGAEGYKLFLRAIRKETEHKGHEELYKMLVSGAHQQVDVGIEPALAPLIKCLKTSYSQSNLFRFSSGPIVNAAEYIDLALILDRKIPENIKQAARFVEKTIHGVTDDIKRDKKRIELKDIFDDGNQCFRMVLVEGAPGIGKTVLASYLCFEWAMGNLLQEYECVLLVHLRHFQSKVFTTVLSGQQQEREFSVSDLVKEYQGGETGFKASEYLIKTSGENTLIILEGWDELPPDLRVKSIFFRIIIKQVLPACSCLVTSRPWCSEQLHRYFNRRIEILGFTTEEMIKTYIEKNASDKKKEIYTYLRNHPNIKRFAYVPQTLSIICKIVQNAEEAPLTLTQLYQVYILNKIHLNLTRDLSDRPYPDSFEALPGDMRVKICAMSQLAFDGFMEKRFVFRAEDMVKVGLDMNAKFDSYGLMNSFPCYAGAAYETYYQFQHLTVQEYMAAYHFLQLEQDKQQEQLTKLCEKQKEYEVMCKFISGICHLKNVEIQKSLIENTRKRSNEDQLFLLQCAFEAHNEDAYEHAAVYLDRRLELANMRRSLTPTDCLSIAYIVGQTGGDWYLEFRGSKLGGEGLEILRYHLEELQSCKEENHLLLRIDLACNDLNGTDDGSGVCGALVTANLLRSSAFQVVEIDIGSNEQFGDEGTRILAEALKTNKYVTILKMKKCSVTHSGGKYLADMLYTNDVLIEIFMRWNELGDKGAEHLSAALRCNKTLQFLSIGDNAISQDGWKHICDMLKVNKGLKCLRVEWSSINSDMCKLLVESFSSNDTLTRIDFLKNPLHDAGLKVITDGLLLNPCCNLRHLGLHGCSITDEGIKAICSLILHKRLRGIQLGLNPGITDVGARLLAESLKTNTDLKKLRLENTKITDEGKELLSVYNSSVAITYEVNTNTKDLLKDKRKTKTLASYSSY